MWPFNWSLHELKEIIGKDGFTKSREHFMEPHNGQLPVGLIAEMVRCCTGIAEIRVPVSFRPEISRPFSHYCLNGTHDCKDH